MFDIKRLFTNGSVIGRFEYFKIFLTIMSFSLFFWVIFSLIHPTHILFVPAQLFSLACMMLVSIIWGVLNYKRISNIFDNTTKTIVTFILLYALLAISTIVYNPIYSLLVVLALMVTIKGKKSSDKIVSNYLIFFSLIIIVIMLLFNRLSGFYHHIVGHSMSPTLEPNDLIATNNFNKNYKRGDIITYKNKEYIFVGRIIGLPNEKIEIRKLEGSSYYVYINDKKLIEPYIKNVYNYPVNIPVNNIVIPPNNYYILGDNREIAKDSRYIGPILKEDIQGIVSHTYLPPIKFDKKPKIFETPDYTLE